VLPFSIFCVKAPNLKLLMIIYYYLLITFSVDCGDILRIHQVQNFVIRAQLILIINYCRH
jgi:hypothetical protein